MKKLFFLSIFIIVHLCVLGQTFEVENIEYSINSDSEATITGANPDGVDTTDLIIPSTVSYEGNEYIVTEIHAQAFAEYTNIDTLEVPGTVTYIQEEVFATSSPWYQNQDDGVIYINNVLYTYKGTMPDNTSILVREGTVCISTQAFYECTGLVSVDIPSTVEMIDYMAFAECTGLTSIEIPSKSVGTDVVSGCTNLTSVTLHNSISHFSWGVLEDCPNITDLTYNCIGGIGSFGSMFGNSQAPLITSLTIGSDVDIIPNWLRSLMSGVQTLNLDENNNNYSLVDDVLYSNNGATLVKCLSSKEGDFIIPNTVTEIKESAFSSCTNLTSIEIPNTVSVIPNSAFSNCTGLESIEIPESVTEIGGGAFSDCTGLTSIEIPNSVTSIGWNAFYGCTDLTSIEIPNSVTRIGSYAFEMTPWFDNKDEGLIYINDVLYTYKGNMPENTTISVREGTKAIADGAFSDQDGIISIEIPNTVTEIGWGAFSTTLNTITMFALTPPVVSELEISEDCIIYVPNEAYNTYRNHRVWGQYDIQKMFDTSVSDIDTPESEIEMTINNGKLDIYNPQNYPINIYNIQGQQVTIENAVNGLYFIQIGDSVHKVIVQ
ncbi:MAG: leucine-rich repeat domain-containing protein [Bacteroidales bacterium]